MLGKGAGAGRAGRKTSFSCVPSYIFWIVYYPLVLSNEDSNYKMNSSFENYERGF